MVRGAAHLDHPISRKIPVQYTSALDRDFSTDGMADFSENIFYIFFFFWRVYNQVIKKTS